MIMGKLVALLDTIIGILISQVVINSSDITKLRVQFKELKDAINQLEEE